MTDTIRTSDKAPNLGGEPFSLVFQPSKITAKMLPATADQTATCCSRTNCTNPITIGQTVKVHPSSGKAFHDMADCNGTRVADLPKTTKSATQAAELATLQAELADLRAMLAKATKK